MTTSGKNFYSILFVLTILSTTSLGNNTNLAGFYLPDSVREESIHYESFNNLIVISVLINNTIKVNLIVDTGCRNLVLFGKSFQKKFNIDPSRKIRFSGLGDGDAIDGGLALHNKINIGAVFGNDIPIVIVPDKNLFGSLDHIDGVIGYDIFIRFEIELNPSLQKIIFRPALHSTLQNDYTRIPVRIEDSKIIMNSTISFQNSNHVCDLIIDTGSSLGLLLKTTDIPKFKLTTKRKTIGQGFNGYLEGIETIVNRLTIDGMEFNNLKTNITTSPWYNYASIGMEVLKDYSIVINYCQQFIGMKKVSVS